MTNESEPTETPEVETPAPVAQPVVAPPPPPRRRATDSPILRIGLGVIAAALIFFGGFATGHWVFDRHDNDHRRPDFSARAQRFMQGLGQPGGGQSRNGPQMGQAPNLQLLLPLLQQMLTNRNGGGGSRGSSNAAPDDTQRRIQQLERQVKELQDQLKATPTPTPTPR